MQDEIVPSVETPALLRLNTLYYEASDIKKQHALTIREATYLCVFLKRYDYGFHLIT